MDTEKGKIYPGVPEYFDSEGKDADQIFDEVLNMVKEKLGL